MLLYVLRLGQVKLFYVLRSSHYFIIFLLQVHTSLCPYVKSIHLYVIKSSSYFFMFLGQSPYFFMFLDQSS